MSLNRSPQPARFQFSLATLLFLMTFVAVVLGLSATAIGSYVLSLLIWMIVSTIPTAMVTTAIFGRGNVQTFAIGSLVPMAPLMLNGVYFISSTTSIFRGIVTAVVLIVAGVFGGMVAVFTRRWVERRGDIKPTWFQE